MQWLCLDHLRDIYRAHSNNSGVFEPPASCLGCYGHILCRSFLSCKISSSILDNYIHYTCWDYSPFHARFEKLKSAGLPHSPANIFIYAMQRSKLWYRHLSTDDQRLPPPTHLSRLLDNIDYKQVRFGE